MGQIVEPIETDITGWPLNTEDDFQEAQREIFALGFDVVLTLAWTKRTSATPEDQPFTPEPVRVMNCQSATQPAGVSAQSGMALVWNGVLLESVTGDDYAAKYRQKQ